MGVVKALIPLACDPAVFWHVFVVSVTKNVYTIMRSEETWGMKKTVKEESKDTPDTCFMTWCDVQLMPCLSRAGTWWNI